MPKCGGVGVWFLVYGVWGMVFGAHCPWHYYNVDPRAMRPKHQTPYTKHPSDFHEPSHLLPVGTPRFNPGAFQVFHHYNKFPIEFTL